MAKLWAGRTDGLTDKLADELNSSIRFDQRMARQDITASMAHAAMLGKQGILSPAEAEQLQEGLAGILEDLQSGALQIDPAAEDIHMFVEEVLTGRLGDVGKKLHTARSRNDQVAQDLRLWLRDEAQSLEQGIAAAAAALADKAEEYADAVMPGYTHLQRAQPILFGHHLMAYAWMLLRDLDRLADWKRRMNLSPIGSCALAGTTYPIDRRFEAAKLGFDGITPNSIDGVSDRDFCLELLADLSILMMHLSRLAEELILWSSWEFRFIAFSDAFTTGSSIMPQKKNPDMAELLRGKTGRVYGDLMGLLTTMKGLPLAYNKDMQEDKEAVFDAVDTAKLCLSVLAPMLSGMTAFPETMRKAAAQGFINATDLADYLVEKGLPFRSAYKVAGQAVAVCSELGCSLELLPLAEYRKLEPRIGEDVYAAIDLTACVLRRSSEGGTGPESLQQQLAEVRQALEKIQETS